MTQEIEAVETAVRRAALADGPSASAFFRHLEQAYGGAAAWSSKPLVDLYVAYASAEGCKSASARVAELLLTTAVGAKRLGISDDTLADARQIVFERLTATTPPKIASYDGRGPLGAWLRVAVAREALYLHRKQGRPGREMWAEEIVELTAAEEDPELSNLKHELREACRSALAGAASSLSPRERALLRQHTVLGMTVDDLGRVYGVHRATAARWVASAREALLDGFYARVEEALGVDREEARALRRLVQSRLDVSCGSLFATTES